MAPNNADPANIIATRPRFVAHKACKECPCLAHSSFVLAPNLLPRSYNIYSIVVLLKRKSSVPESCDRINFGLSKISGSKIESHLGIIMKVTTHLELQSSQPEVYVTLHESPRIT